MKRRTHWLFALAFPVCSGLPGLALAWAFLYFQMGRWDLVGEITGIFWFLLALQLLYELAGQRRGGLFSFARYFTLVLKLLVALLGHVFFLFSVALSQMQGPKAVLCLSVLALCAAGNLLLAVRELRLCRRDRAYPHE